MPRLLSLPWFLLALWIDNIQKTSRINAETFTTIKTKNCNISGNNQSSTNKVKYHISLLIWNSFNKKLCENEICWQNKAGKSGEPVGGGEVCPPLLFWVAKKKGETKEKRSFKVKRLSPRSQYYWFSHSGASIIQNIFLKADHGSRQYFSVFYALPFEIHFTGPAKFKFWTNTFKKCFWKIRIPESLLHGKFELFKHYLVTCTRKWSFPKGEGDLRFW